MGHGKLLELSAFFPLYNEEKNVSPLIEEALEVLPQVAENYEILLINDGSTDRTQAIAETLAEQYEQVRVITQPNLGYGGALKTGFSESKYDWIFFSDGDRQFRLAELKNFLWHTSDFDLVMGFRLKRAEGLLRKLITLGLKVWNKLLFNFPLVVKDIDCAFKLIRREVLEDTLPLVSDGGMISTEFLLKAIRKGHKLKQVPVKHYKREFGSSTGDSLKVIKKAVVETGALLKEFPEEWVRVKLGALCASLFLLLLPVSTYIDFMQNDDYTHYRLVEQFMRGDFALDAYIGATFYLQGLLGAGFASLFGLAKLPVLTLLVSVGALYVFLRLLYDFVTTDPKTVILGGALLVLNPLFLYSSWGFMTENYFLLFFLLSYYFILKFIDTEKGRDFWLANGMIVLSYFVRQFAFVTSLALGIYLLIRKKFKLGLMQLLLFGGLLLFHYQIFPITPQMYDAGLSLGSLANTERTLSLVYVVGIYMAIFTLPLIFVSFLNANFVRSKLKIMSLFFIIPLTVGMLSFFNPKAITFDARLRSGKVVPQFAKVEFPYLENVFGRKGFLEDNLGGTKYHYPGFFDLFNYLDIVGKIGVSALILLLLYNIRYLFSFSFIYIAGFGALIVVAPRVFDRYLLGLVPVVIVLLAALNTRFHKIQRLIVIGYALFLLILGYQYSADLISVNKYVWTNANKVHAETGVSKERINVNHSWRNLYPVENRNWVYYYEYSESKRRNSVDFMVKDTHTIEYPFSFYIKPEVVLFERISGFDN